MENEIQPIAPLTQSTVQPPINIQPTHKNSNWLKITLIVILGLSSLTGSVYAGIQIGKNQTITRQIPIPASTEVNSQTPSPTKKGECESNDQCPLDYYCETRSDFLDIESPGTNIYGICVKKDAICAKEGENANWVQNIECCEGLKPIALSFPPSCSISKGGSSAGLCTKCGNKICGTGENICNCPEDCK